MHPASPGYRLGFLALTKALMNLPSTGDAIASTSIPMLDSNSRASAEIRERLTLDQYLRGVGFVTFVLKGFLSKRTEF